MNISPINSNNTNFKGKVIIKGTWTQELKDAILNNADDVTKAALKAERDAAVEGLKAVNGNINNASKVIGILIDIIIINTPITVTIEVINCVAL